MSKKTPGPERALETPDLTNKDLGGHAGYPLRSPQAISYVVLPLGYSLLTAVPL